MSSKIPWLKIIAFLLLLTFYGTILAQKINVPSAADLPRQIIIGKTIIEGNFDILYKNIYAYTEPEQNFYNHHWLSGVVFYLFHETVEFEGLVILKILTLLTAFSLLFFTATKKADFWLVAFFAIPTILILAERGDVRPEMFSYLFIAAYLYLLVDFEQNPDRKRIFWLIPLQLLWVNMHVFFSIGIMMVGAFLFEQIIIHWRNLKGNLAIKKLLILFVAVIIISCVNPRGIEGVVYRYPKGPVVINENVSLATFQKSSPPWDDVSATLFKPLMVLVGASFLFGFRRKKPIFYFLAATATSVLGFIILRSIAMFGMIFLLAITTNLNNIFERCRRWLREESTRITTIFGITSAIGLILAMGYLAVVYAPNKLLRYSEIGIGAKHGSSNSAAFFKEQGLKGPIFNDANSGSYLIYYLYPQEKVFTDNRFADAYTASFFSDAYFASLTDESAWQKNMEKYDFNIIFFHHFIAGLEERKFLIRRVNDPEWALIYTDMYNLILVRDRPENSQVIEKFRITQENAFEKLKHLINSSFVDDQIAAADVMNILGRSDLALAAYFKIVSTWPDRFRVWQVMGQMEASQDNPTDLVLATTFFQRAIDEGARTAEIYSYLGHAYYKLNLIENARASLLKALDLDPEWKDAQELLETIKKETGK